MRHITTCSALLLTLLTLAAPAAAQTARAAAAGKPGGVLKPVLREDLPQGFAIHESATNSVTWPAMPCYSNLVDLRPAQAARSAPTPSCRSWPRSGPGRTTTATWSSFSGRTSSGTTASPSPRRTSSSPSTWCARPRTRPRSCGSTRAKNGTRNVERDRGARRLHGGLPAEAAAALAARHARLRATRPVLPAHVPLAEHRARCIGHRPLQVQGVEARRVRRAREEPRLLRQGPALPRRHALHRHRRARHAGGRAAGRPGRRGLSRATPRSSIAEQLKGAVPEMVFTETATQRQREPPAQHEEGRPSTTSRCAARSASPSTAGLHAGRAPGQRHVGAAMAPKPWGVWGLLEKDLAQLAGLRQGRGGQGARQEAPRRGRLRPVQPAQASRWSRAPSRSTSTSPPSWSASSSRSGGGHAQADRHRAVAPDGHPPGVPRSGPTSPASGWTIPTPTSTRTTPAARPGTTADYCNEEVMRLIDQQSQETDPQKRLALVVADPEEARGGRGPAHHGLAHRSLRALPVREEPDPEPGHLQLLPAPGRLARQVAATEMARAYRLGVARRIVNGIIIRTLLRMGWGPARTYLLITRGRATGRSIAPR